MPAMEYDDYIDIDDTDGIINKDWLKSSDASLAKLQEVGTKVYNLGIADTRQLRVNKNNLQSRTASNSNLLSNGAKSAWGSNSSIPDLLRRQSERQRQQKVTRPVSAKVNTQAPPTKTRRRPQSAKELGGTSEKKPPTGLGVKGMHRDLEERPPGGIGVGAGSGWAAPPGGVLGMSGKEIDDLLGQVSDSQRPSRAQTGSRTGPPPPPRGSPDFSEMLNTKDGKGPEFTHMIEDLLFDKNMLPSEILTRPPPEPIHITMPQATLDVDCSESPDNDDGYRISNSRSPDFHAPPVSKSDPTRSQKKSLDINMNTQFDDGAPWQSVDETDDEEILVEARPARQPLRMRTVTFNEEKNETTLITPRGGKSKKSTEEDLDLFDSTASERSESRSFDALGDQLPKSQHKNYGQTEGPPAELPKPKLYSGRPDLKWVKSKTDSGVQFASQDEGGKGASRKGSGRESSRTSAGVTEDSSKTLPTVCVAFFDDLLPEGDTQTTPKPTAKPKKPSRSHLHDDVETMVSRVGMEKEQLQNQGEKNGAVTSSETQWATPASLRTKTVSSNQKNYYESALQARMTKHRSQLTNNTVDDNTRTKTIKTLELGDGEVIEHKMVSTVDRLQHQKKEYVVPKDARPQSAARNNKTQGGAHSSTDVTDRSASKHFTDLLGRSQDKESDSHRQNEDERDKLTTKDKVSQGSYRGSPRKNLLQAGANAKANDQRPGSSRGTKAASSSSERACKGKTSADLEGTLSGKECKKEDRLEVPVDKNYTEFENVKLKKARAASAPVRRGPTLEGGKLKIGGTGLGVLASSPYAAPALKPRPYSASAISDMKKRPGSAQHVKISTKLSYKEVQRVKSAAKLVKKGTLGHPKVYNLEKHYSNYNKPPPPKPFVPAIRQKKMAEAAAATASASAKERKESSVVQLWTRQDDFEVETEGIQECKKIQDKLLEQGVPVTLDTLTRALLPPGECALRGATYVTSTNPTLPEDTSRLLSKPAIWFPEEFNRLQRARKLAQRAEQSLKEQDWEERSRMFMTSEMSVGSTAKKTKKKKKKKKKTEDIMSRSSSGLL